MNSGSQTHECTKRECYFCYITAEHEPRTVTIMKPVFASDSKYNNPLTTNEFELLFSNINEPYDVLLKLLPIRSRKSIQTIKCVYAKQFGWQWNGKIWERI